MVYGSRYKFQIFRQTMGLALTAQFEYINETIANYDKIMKKITNIENNTPFNLSYIRHNWEELSKRRNTWRNQSTKYRTYEK